MSVSESSLRVGAVFRFKSGPRRIVKMEPLGNGFNIFWEFADGVKRAGKLFGRQWSTYFRREAIEEIPDEGFGSRLLKSGKTVVSRAESVTIDLQTKCPQKWAMVDMETGEVWGHDGERFRRFSEEDLKGLRQVLQA